MVTITDVALEAKVSVATVSRAINNSFLVAEEKVERINAAIKKLGYQPTSRMRQGKQNKVIVIITSVLIAELMDGINSAARAMGYQIAYSYTGESAEGYRDALNFLKALPEECITGIILINNMCRDEAVLKEFNSYPVVQIGEYMEFSPCFVVLTDDILGAADMTQYLIQKGHRRIAFVTASYLQGQRTIHFAKDREEGFRRVLRENDIPFDEELRICVEHTSEGGIDAAQRIIAMKERPDAVFCIADVIAASCVTELQMAGVRVPEDIAVAGYDNMEISEYCRPHLTTVAQSFDDIGAEAVRTLDMIAGGILTVGRKIYISHLLLEREST